MLAAVRERITVPIETLINTHSDGDHVWGNQLLAGAEIVATRVAARVIREETPDQMARFKVLAGALRHLTALERILALDVDVVVPGHGPVGGRPEV